VYTRRRAVRRMWCGSLRHDRPSREGRVGHRTHRALAYLVRREYYTIEREEECRFYIVYMWKEIVR
jgi:hypothetical protein